MKVETVSVSNGILDTPLLYLLTTIERTTAIGKMAEGKKKKRTVEKEQKNRGWGGG